MRDLKADLELCERATPGPWIQDQSCVRTEGYTLFYTYMAHQGDARFIAAARKGWPHAIERAIKAEAELAGPKEINARLREENDLQRASIQELSRKIAGMENPDIEHLSSNVHDSWWKEKKEQGFHAPLSCPRRSPANRYGKFEPVCDKCHTDMYPYEELPENIKEYDRVTVRTVLQALDAVKD